MSEKVGIEINLIGADKAAKTLEAIESTTRRLGAKRTMIKMENGSLISVEERIKQIQDRLAVLKSQKRLKLLDASQKREMQRLNAELDVLNRGLKNGTANAKTFKQVFNSISSQVAHAGSAMQSFGNALTRIGSFMRPITTGLLMGAGYKALNMLTEGFGGAFERADIMANYAKQLKAFGFEANEAQDAIGRLNESVIGLPTGLDEIMAVQKRFVSASKDIQRSTDLAIAFNNAILASDSDARQQITAQRLLTQLAGGAELAPTSWQALQRAIPMVFTMLADDAKMSMPDYLSALQKGKISTEEFMDAFTKIGTKGAVKEAVDYMKISWGSLAANIINATRRMGQGVIESLNEVFRDKTGRSLLETLLGFDSEGNDLKNGIKDWINGISTSVQDWVKAHPDRIIEFFNNLKAIDFKGLLKGVAKGMGDILGIIERLAKLTANKDMSKVGKFLAKSGFYGRALTIFGGLIKGMRHPIAGIGTVGTWLFGKAKNSSFFGKIAAFFGKKKDVEAVGDIGGAIAKASPKLISAFQNMALISGIVAMPAFTAWGVTSAVKNSIKNFKEIITLLKDMDWSAAAKVAGGIAAFLGVSAGIGGLVGTYGVGAGVSVAIGETLVGLIMSIATGFFDLNMAFIKGGIKNFVDSIKLLQDIPDVESFGDVKTKISNAITMMNEISALFQGRYVDKGVQEGGLQNVGFGTAWAVSNFAKTLASLKDAVQSINELASMSIPPNAVNRIGDIIESIGELQSKMWILMGFGFGNIKNNMTKVADAMYELRRVIYHVRKLAGEKISTKGLENVTDAISKIREAFDAKAVSDIRGTITAFVASIQDAFTMLDKLNTPIEIKASVKLARDFKTSVDAVVREIGLAKQRIDLAWAGIPTFLLTKTITFNLNGETRTNGIYDSSLNGMGNHLAKGGMLYRARGGGVPWRRRGTDTVPAMLTPGEYVHNKRAVSAFGIDFMRKVNNLDMKGAMDELMHRAGHMANINRGTSITNNYNNNQKVVINNNGSVGAGFTFKSASRFVGAF